MTKNDTETFRHTVDYFLGYRKPGRVAWVVLKIIHYRIRFYCAGQAQFTDSFTDALCWEDREQAYAIREKLGGLIIIVE